MTKQNDPINPTTQSQSGVGLTKREHFAALAMQGLISSAHSSEESRDKYTCNGGWVYPDTIAQQAVNMADALIAELNKPLNPTL